MKCKQCKMIEMFVAVRNKKEVVYHCPKCHEILKISTDEEQKELEKENEEKSEAL